MERGLPLSAADQMAVEAPVDNYRRYVFENSDNAELSVPEIRVNIDGRVYEGDTG